VGAAIDVSTVLRVGDEQVVSRGDFIRAAVKTLELPVGSENQTLPYQRVARGLIPFVAVAHEYGALETLGSDLQLARGITRGQALVIMAALQQITGDGDVSFTDVRKGSREADAVSVAVQKGWMEPMRGTYFGVRRLLKGSEARLLLRKLLGETETDQEVPERLQRAQQITVRLDGLSSVGSLPKQEILETVWQYVLDNYIYEEDIDPEEAAYRAAEALVDSLGDTYSTFLRPEGANNLETQINGEVSGIGAQVEQRDGILMIVSPLRGSPAERAGLLPEDEILKADGVELQGMGFIEAVDHVRGPKGTVVTLTIRRAGRIFDVVVTRDVVKVPEVDISWQGDIAVVQIMQFGTTTETQLRDALIDVQRQDPKGLILDLRNNPGGLLHAADVVVSNFVPKGSTVAQIISREGVRTDASDFAQTIPSSVPVVVLVNKGSASASEIVAGALQDHGRATLIGTQTFGKGTVQQVLRFNDNSGMKITVAEWRTPNGRKINGVGIAPNIVVEYQSERDEQMLKALEILR